MHKMYARGLVAAFPTEVCVQTIQNLPEETLRLLHDLPVSSKVVVLHPRPEERDRHGHLDKGKLQVIFRTGSAVELRLSPHIPLGQQIASLHTVGMLWSHEPDRLDLD